MIGQKCSNCGYYMEGGEAIVNNVLHVVGGILGNGALAQKAFGTNTISNATSMPCPNCGARKRWIREDE